MPTKIEQALEISQNLAERQDIWDKKDLVATIKKLTALLRNIRDEKQEVLVTVSGGVADLESKPEGVRVIIRDYDNMEDDEGKQQTDAVWE